MRYYTWQLIWTDDDRYGDGPEATAYSNGTKLEASMFEHANSYLGYSDSDVDTAALSAWNVNELTQAEALAFAQTIRPDAYLEDNGVINIVEDIS